MKRNILPLLLILSFTVHSAFANTQTVTLNLPEAVLADAIQKSLPIEINEVSEALAGTIAVSKIDNLNLSDQSLAASITMSGRDVQVNTDIGGHQIKLNVGNVELNFDVNAALRYDKTSQTLFVLPKVADQDANKKNNDVGNLIIALFNGKEIPLAIDKLQPFITDIGSKKLMISMQVADVIVVPDALVIHIIPETSVQNQGKK